MVPGSLAGGAGYLARGQFSKAYLTVEALLPPQSLAVKALLSPRVCL
jgi:hypothetical protein